METRTEILIFLGIAVILFVASLGFYFSKSIQSPLLSQTPLPECNSLYGSSGEIGIVFFSDEESARKYADHLLEVSPFYENKAAFNFFYITPESYAPKCDIYKGIAVLCHSSSLIKAASSCPADYIVALSDQPKDIRSSSYLNVMSLNLNHPLSVFIHEFGHSFGNLAEEYVPAKIPRGAENCQATCDGFSLEVDGCYEGCSKSSYFRSVEAGVMRTLSSTSYGSFNSNLLRNLIADKVRDQSITGAATQDYNSCHNERYFLISGKILDEEVVIEKESIESGCTPDYTSLEGDLTYKAYSGESIIEGEVALSLFTDSGSLEEIQGEVFEGEEFFITLPYNPDTTSIEITDVETGKTIFGSLQNIGENIACHL